MTVLSYMPSGSPAGMGGSIDVPSLTKRVLLNGGRGTEAALPSGRAHARLPARRFYNAPLAAPVAAATLSWALRTMRGPRSLAPVQCRQCRSVTTDHQE